MIVVLAACASPAPSPTPTPTASPTPTPTTVPSASPAPSEDASALYESIEEQVIAIRGLQPKRDVVPKVLDETELRALMTE